MRIAIITETFLPDVNGVVTTLCRQLEHLQAAGHTAMVFAPHGDVTTYAGAEVVPLRGVPFPLYPELQFTPPQGGISARLRQFKPDLLHLAGPIALGATGCYVAKRLGVPLVSAYHTDFPAYSSHYGLGWARALAYHYLRWVHNHCMLTLCPSTTTMADLRTHGFRRLRLWRRGVDTERFHPRFRSEAWRASVGLRAGERLLLYVGRLATEKRVEMLADALHGVDGARLVFVGDGPAAQDLKQRLAGAPVHFTGFLRGEELATAYASADLFVFPSNTETFGQVIQEAMASGTPVVAARAGGALDLIHEGKTGTLFTPGSITDLQQHIAHMLEQPAQRVAMGRAGRAAAEQRSWQRVMEELVEHYERVLHRCHQSHMQQAHVVTIPMR